MSGELPATRCLYSPLAKAYAELKRAHGFAMTGDEPTGCRPISWWEWAGVEPYRVIPEPESAALALAAAAALLALRAWRTWS